MNHPILITDTREQRPLIFSHLVTERGTLQSGDYSVKGLEHEFAIERKSVADLLGSLTKGRDRFERELHRLRGFSFARVLIVGEPHELHRTAANSKAIFSSITSLEVRWQVPFVWEASPQLAARLVERWAWFMYRERIALGRMEPCPIEAVVCQGEISSM